MLLFSKESDAKILHDFECGIDAMDEFIHGDLDSFLKNDPRYQFFVVREKESEQIVAMYVISNGIFIDNNNEFNYLPFGEPWGYLDDDWELHESTKYSTLEIDYLAVKRELRERGYGRQIINELSRMAAQKDLFFLTVEAYYDNNYSAIPFYEKNGFFPLQELSPNNNTLRMAMRVVI